MDRFRFSPELLGHRGDALAALAEGGYSWLSDFEAVDVLQDLYGLEVSGIADRSTARRILALLRRRFDGWSHGAVSLRVRKGWRARLHRDPST
ncbi:MAG: hypothetical protein M9894_29930 [Planctomycetes bacterium]|nr:hypothetical protein [Planctomycetota bacterium]